MKFLFIFSYDWLNTYPQIAGFVLILDRVCLEIAYFNQMKIQAAWEAKSLIIERFHCITVCGHFFMEYSCQVLLKFKRPHYHVRAVEGSELKMATLVT